MNPPLYSPHACIDPKARVRLWAQRVALESATLRTRQILTPVSLNARPEKRKVDREPSRVNPARSCKRFKSMTSLNTEAVSGHTEQRRGRGRGRPPRGSRGTERGRGQLGTTNIASALSPSLTPEAPSIPDSTSSTRSRSPKKRSGKDVLQPRPDVSIDMKFLESCRPSVRLRSPREARLQGALPQNVADLYNLLSDTPAGFVPAQLKVYSIYCLSSNSERVANHFSLLGLLRR